MAEITKLNGIPLSTETIEDNFDKALAVHEFPYRDLAIIEDMGQKARKVRIRCYFWDDTYEQHKNIIDLLKDQQSFELEHPKYGLLKGSIESVSTRHDDLEQTAIIDFTFIEGETGVEATIITSIEATAEELYELGLGEVMDEYMADLPSGVGSEDKGILGTILDEGSDILDQFSGLSAGARAYMKKVDAVVRTVEGTLAAVTTPANALISTITFATDLPGRLIGSFAKVASRYTELFDTLKNAPDRFMQSLMDAFGDLEDSMFPAHKRDYARNISLNVAPMTSIAITDADTHTWKAFKSVCALEAALQSSIAFESDEEDRTIQKRLEEIPSFDTQGNYIKPEESVAVMNVREVENTLYTAQEMAQEAIDISRPNENLKQMITELIQHVNVIKLEREKIITKELDHETPLHLVCLIYGLPYNSADRILAINDIKNPNFCSGEIDIYEG